MKLLVCSIFLIVFLPFYSQNEGYKSIIQEQSNYYRSFNLSEECQFDSLMSAEKNRKKIDVNTDLNVSSCVLNKKIFGWHPYWVGSTYTAYQWNLLSDLCYFNYDISSSTGNNTNTSFAWSTASVVTVAKNNGTNIHLCATMFTGHASFWVNSAAQTTFITNIVNLLNLRGGNGVNIDFEGMGASDKVPFVNFLTNLKTALVAASSNYQLSVCLYAVDLGGAFNIPSLNTLVDFYTIMGYDYYYGGSSIAGPTSPLYNLQTSYNYTISKSITTYIKAGASPAKLILGLPYYGREWEVSTNVIPATTTGTFSTSHTLSYINNTPIIYNSNSKAWEPNSYSPYYAYQNTNIWRQCFIDDVYSLGRKYDLVNQRGLGGIGIWALGYDAGMSNYWTLIQDKFTNCAPIVCNDSIFDMGGPSRNYYDNEDYTYSLIAPTGSLVNLQFTSFDVEQGYDSLFLYDGLSTSSAFICAYTGSNTPGTVKSTGQNLTLRFKSDGATTKMGFKVIKSCSPQLLNTNIQTNSELFDLLVYPNPTSGKLFFNSKNLKSFDLFNASGELILSELTGGKSQLDFSNLDLISGLYFIRLKAHNGKEKFQKIIYSR